MAEFDLNLSTRPFPAYRLVNLALAAVLVALIVISVWQVSGFLRFSNMARSIRAGEQELHVESETLGRRLDGLKARIDRPESAAKLSEIGFLNRIIARKELSWTELFANLENMVPETVHLISLRPETLADNTARLAIDARGRSIQDIKEFLVALEQSPVFEKVEVSKEEPNTGGGTNVTISTYYFPNRETR